MGREWIVRYKWGREGKREGVVWWLVVERGGWRGCEWWMEGWEGEEVMKWYRGGRGYVEVYDYDRGEVWGVKCEDWKEYREKGKMILGWDVKDVEKEFMGIIGQSID